MEDRLKPCPFCGGEARVEEHKFWNDITRSFDIKTYSVVCDECSSTSFQHYRIKQEAIKAWNTRKPMDRIVEQLEEVSFVETVEEYAEINLLLLDDAIEIVKAGGIDE